MKEIILGKGKYKVIVSDEDYDHLEYIQTLPPEDTDTHKTCTRCKNSKLRSEYYSYKYSKDKLNYNCKACIKEVNDEQSLKRQWRKTL